MPILDRTIVHTQKHRSARARAHTHTQTLARSHTPETDMRVPAGTHTCYDASSKQEMEDKERGHLGVRDFREAHAGEAGAHYGLPLLAVHLLRQPEATVEQ